MSTMTDLRNKHKQADVSGNLLRQLEISSIGLLQKLDATAQE